VEMAKEELKMKKSREEVSNKRVDVATRVHEAHLKAKEEENEFRRTFMQQSNQLNAAILMLIQGIFSQNQNQLHPNSFPNSFQNFFPGNIPQNNNIDQDFNNIDQNRN